MAKDYQMMDRAISYCARIGNNGFRHNKFALLTRKGGSWREEEVRAISAMHTVVTGVATKPEHIIVTGGVGLDALKHVLNCDDFEFYETSNRLDPKLPFNP